MQLDIRLVVRRWLPVAATSAVLCLLVYASVQHAQRSGADEPQIQLAEDAARALERGVALESVIPAGNVAIAESLAPFVIAYDEAGKPLAGSGRYRDRLLSPPRGVFEYVRATGEERVTWQPAPDVRIAAVVVRSSASPAAFVLAGRSLREVERREYYTRIAAAAGLLVTVLGSLVLIVLGELLF